LIKIIAGRKGSGKTKRLIGMTNDSAKNAHSDIVFIDDDNRYMFDVHTKVRFINAGEYGITTTEMFFGFICGTLSQNFDVGLVFIDAFKKLIKSDLWETQWFFDRIMEISRVYHVEFILSVSEDPDDLPDFMKAFLI